MTRWAGEPPRKHPPDVLDPSSVTDDPLAAIGLDVSGKGAKTKAKVYAVSRINPLFHITPLETSATSSYLLNKTSQCSLGQRSTFSSCAKSTSYEQVSSSNHKKSKNRSNHNTHEDNIDLIHDEPDKPRNDFLRGNSTTPSVFSRHLSRDKLSEIDYNNSLPRLSLGFHGYSKKFASGYVQKENLLQNRKQSLLDKCDSSGYGGSNEGNSLEQFFNDRLQHLDETGAILEQNPAFVKSIRIAGRGLKTTKSVPSQHSASSAGGTLTTIPEGKVDFSIPQPIWPGPVDQKCLLNSFTYDSLVDEALLLYTSLNNRCNLSDNQRKQESLLDISVKDLLLDLLASINQTLEGETGSPEKMLKIVTEKIKLQLEILRHCSEEEMRNLCVNLSNSSKVNSVLRAFSHSSSSGNSTSSGRPRTNSSNDDDLYHIPSGSSSSGFSDSPPNQRRPSTPLLSNFYGRKSSILSQFYTDQDNSTLSRGVRNALIYGTLCRHKIPSFSKVGFQPYSDLINSTPRSEKNTCVTVGGKREQKIENTDGTLKEVENVGINDLTNNSISCARSKLTFLNKNSCDKNNFFGKELRKNATFPKRELLEQKADEKPSVWQLYYGVQADGCKPFGEGRPTDVPVFPGGRPETDFTLDLPRSELLSKRLREDKKWRFRCRLLTSFLGLVFFLLSVMAVSLVLTRGKRMFGSMV